MPKSHVDSAALLAAAIAGALALMLLRPFDWLSSIGGLTLLLILLAYDREGYRTVFQSLAFSAVCGFCLMLAASIVFRLLTGSPELQNGQGQVFDEWLPLTWAGATLILWVIDRARMGGRQETAPERVGRPVPAHRSFIPEFAPPPPASPSAPAPETAFPQTAPPAPVYREPAPATMPVSPAAPSPTPVAAAAPPARPGKETMIYVTLVGEGLNVLRSVRAEHLGRDFYRIIDSMPEGETWEYRSGQVVRCKKKNLSSGKALVAIEEAPRAS